MRSKILQDVLWNQKTKAVSMHSFLHKQNNYLCLQVSCVSLVIVFVCSWKEGIADQRSQGQPKQHQDYTYRSRAVERKEKEWEILAELIKRQLWQEKSALNTSCMAMAHCTPLLTQGHNKQVCLYHHLHLPINTVHSTMNFGRWPGVHYCTYQEQKPGSRRDYRAVYDRVMEMPPKSAMV